MTLPHLTFADRAQRSHSVNDGGGSTSQRTASRNSLVS